MMDWWLGDLLWVILSPNPGSRHCSRAHLLPPSGSERSALASCTMDPMARTSGEVWGKRPLEMCLKWSKRGCVDGASFNTFFWTPCRQSKAGNNFNSLQWTASIMAFQNQDSGGERPSFRWDTNCLVQEALPSEIWWFLHSSRAAKFAVSQRPRENGTGKKEAFPNKIPTQLQHVSSFFHFQLPC